MEASEIQINSPETSAKTEEILDQEKKYKREIFSKILDGSNGDDLKKEGYDLNNPLAKKSIFDGLSRSLAWNDYGPKKQSLERKLQRIDKFELSDQEKHDLLIYMTTRNMYISEGNANDMFPDSLEVKYALEMVKKFPEIIDTLEFNQAVRNLITTSWSCSEGGVTQDLVEFIKEVYPHGLKLNPQNEVDKPVFDTIIDRAKKGILSDTESFSKVITFAHDFFDSDVYADSAKEGYCHLVETSPISFEKQTTFFRKMGVAEDFKNTPEFHQAAFIGYKNSLSEGWNSLDQIKEFESRYRISEETIKSPEIENVVLNYFTSEMKNGSIHAYTAKIISERYHFPEIKLNKKQLNKISSNSWRFESFAENLKIVDKVFPKSPNGDIFRHNPSIAKEAVKLYFKEVNDPYGDDKPLSCWNNVNNLIELGIIDKDIFGQSLKEALMDGKARTIEMTLSDVEEVYRLMSHFNLKDCLKMKPKEVNTEIIFPIEYAPPTIEEFLQIEIGNMPSGMKMSDLCRLNSMERGQNIIGHLSELTSLSYRNEIETVLDAQGDAAFYYISKIYYYHREYEDDLAGLRYVAFVGKKYGVEAANIYENLLSHIANLGEKKDILERYLSDIHLPSIRIYELYEKAEKDGEWQEIEKIKEKVNLFTHQIYYGIADKKSYQDELFLAIEELVFPPAVSSLHQSIERIYSKRQDRREDIPHSLNRHQYEKISVETGKFLLGEQTLDVSPWSEVEKITLEVNEAYHLKPNQPTDDIELANKIADYFLNGKDMGHNWLWSQRYRDLYSHFLSLGNEPFEKFDLTSRDGLMGVSEFIEETIKVDVLQRVTDTLKMTNPEKYKQLEDRVIATTKSEWNQDVSVIKNLVNITRKQKDENQRQITVNRLESVLQKYNLALDDVTRDDDSWVRFVNAEIVSPTLKAEYRTENYYNSPEFLSTLDRFEGKRDTQRKTVDRLSNSLFKDVTEKMHKELAKFKFINDLEKETKTLEFIVSKKKEHCLVGLNMGVCVTPDEKLWNDRTFMNCIFLDPESKRAQGGVHFLIREDYLTLPGINPSLSLLGRVNREKLFDRIINYSKEVAQTLGLKGVLIPTSKTIQSNRSQIQTVIVNKKFPKITLKKEANFSYSPFAYSFQECYLV
jgi:hypothetical protein